MQVSVIQVGDSKGIRLSKILLDRYQIADKVQLVLEEDCIVLRPVAEPRKKWAEAFAEMRNNGDDTLLIDSVFEDENWD